MTTLANVDSRHYIIAYELYSRDDVPPDFGQSDALPAFDTGLFLPRAGPDWFGRHAYPPRVVALVPAGLLIVPHPAAKAPTQLLGFEQLGFVECGHMLLRGWLRFVGHDFDRTLFYNTRGAGVVDAFMHKFRARFLPDTHSDPTTGIELGCPLDLKFSYALSHELDAGEAVRASLFRPAVKFKRWTLGLKRTGTVPADLIALTPRRVLWITDRHGSGYARYGSIARYAPLSRIGAIDRESDGDERVLRLAIGSSGIPWRIPLTSEQERDAARIESAILSCRHDPSGIAAPQRAPHLFKPE